MARKVVCGQRVGRNRGGPAGSIFSSEPTFEPLRGNKGKFACADEGKGKGEG